MYYRFILERLREWKEDKNRKPLVLRGARQVGKTTVVKIFSNEFEQYIYVNLEIDEEKKLFEESDNIHQIVDALFFIKDKSIEKETLVFIDEIQSSPKAVAMLRYFYEEYPNLYVISAGSLLENLLNISISFPVGRVSFLVLRPFGFSEFLKAIGEEKLAEVLGQVPIPSFAERKLFNLFHLFIQVGGMPEAVKTYVETRDLTKLKPIYSNLIIAYTEDIEKYTTKNKMVSIIRHIMQNAFVQVGSRIKYAGFGNSNYQSKDIKDAFALLQKAFLFDIIHPTTTTTIPIIVNSKKSPRLHILDTALSIYSLGIEKELFSSKDIEAFFSGKIIEHFIGQEILSKEESPLSKLNFWVREKKQSVAEIDYVIQYRGFVIPIEIKSGASGRLRSLHQFIDEAPHSIAVRLYHGSFSIDKTITVSGKPFTLINLPYFLATKIEKYLDLFWDRSNFN